MPTTPTDEDLLRLMRAGDEEAFVELYRRRQGAVYRFALHMSGSATIAEEVTQEVFMLLIREASRFDATRGSLAAYLYGVARNQVRRCLERDRPYVPIAEDGDDMPAQDDPLGEAARHQTIESVRKAVLALPPGYREVVVLCELHEMSYAEAAEVLGCPVGTVRSRLHRARALLAEKWNARAQAAGPQKCCV